MTEDPEADEDMPGRAKPLNCPGSTQVFSNFQVTTRAGPHATKLEPLRALEYQGRGGLGLSGAHVQIATATLLRRLGCAQRIVATGAVQGARSLKQMWATSATGAL